MARGPWQIINIETLQVHRDCFHVENRCVEEMNNFRASGQQAVLSVTNQMTICTSYLTFILLVNDLFIWTTVVS